MNRGRDCRPRAGFTLIELLAVTVIILALAAITVGVARYVDRVAKTTRARAELAAIVGAVEAFRTDYGRYPTSTVHHYSLSGYFEFDILEGKMRFPFEMYNSALLYQQLTASKGYLPPGAAAAVYYPRFFLCCNESTNPAHVLTDPWERPYVYYCTYPPSGGVLQASVNYTNCSMITRVYTNRLVTGDQILTNWCSLRAWAGGQVRMNSYDLYSFGPDARTYVPGLSLWIVPYGNSAADTADDIWAP